MSALITKIVENKQRRNFLEILRQVTDENIEDSLLEEIYFPQSSEILQKILNKKRDAALKNSLIEKEAATAEEIFLRGLSSIKILDESLLFFFPNYSARSGRMVSDLPVLKIKSLFVENWFHIGTGLGLHFCFCASIDLKSGLILDVYEADPLDDGSSGPVFEIYSWAGL